MKLMPYIDYMGNGKGKRKVVDEEDDRTPHSPYKKASTRVERRVLNLGGEDDLMDM